MSEKPKIFIPWITATILAVCILLSAAVVTYGLIKTRFQPNTITVTGSSKKQIKSDYVTWKASFSRQSANLPDAYKLLEEDQKKVEKYLKDSGLTDQDYSFSAINTQVMYTLLPNGGYSNTVDGYRLIQDVDVHSGNIDKITAISRQSTRLIQDGVQFQSMPPSYVYTKITDLKIDMLALATKDARNRAEKIAQNSNARLGELRSAKMGVFQITPINSNEVSDYGINDTSSVDKEIMAVMNCVFTAN